MALLTELNLYPIKSCAGISLREAILAANTSTAADSIGFSVTGTIQLTNVGHVGEILITNPLTINGPSGGLLEVQAFSGTIAVGDGARIFNVDDGNGANDKAVTISGLVQHELGRIPKVGEEVHIANCRLVIHEADPRVIKSVQIYKEDKHPAQADQPVEEHVPVTQASPER